MKNLFVIALSAVALAGCQEILSNVLVGPDEMSVVDSAPLTLPPSFELRPPRPGQVDATLASETARLKAESLIIGEEAVSAEDIAKQTGTKTAIEEDDAWLFDKIDAEGKSAVVVSEKRESKAIPDKGFFERTFSTDKAE